MTTLLTLDGVSRRHADRQVLQHVSLTVSTGDRVGAVGRNGSGKSTLLGLAAGADQPDGGRVVHRAGLRIAYLAQDPVLDAREHPLEAVRLAVTAGADAGRMEARARGLLAQLGVSGAAGAVGTLSGGQRKRVALARALLEPADVLILDEPTNHLDIDAVAWLEAELAARRVALLLVSHDRYLLEALCNRMVEVGSGGLRAHRGGYAAYLQSRLERVEQEAAAEARRRNRLRGELAWLRRGARARSSKAKYRVEQARELAAAAPAGPDPRMRIDLAAARLGRSVVEVRQVVAGRGPQPVLRGANLTVAPAARLGLVGPNGSGKTTLLDLLAGGLTPTAGSVRRGETVQVGYYRQEPVSPPPGLRVLDAVAAQVGRIRLTDGTEVSAAGLLERFGFPPAAQRARVVELSGGERRRLELLRVLAGAPNLLLLDEPTNDLDLDTLGILEEYLDGWPGALVAVTHDRWFLDRVCRDLVSVEADGTLRHHPAGWPAYLAHLSAGRRDASVPEERRHVAREAARRRKLGHNERRELAALQRRLPLLEQHRDELARALQVGSGGYVGMHDLSARLAAVVAELDAVETRWLELAQIEEGA